MIDADNTTSLQEQLAAHRRTLALLLRQLANLGADHAPPGVHNGIAEARREIARLKAALGTAGVVVEDQAGDETTAEEARAQRAPGATVSIGRDQINAQGSQGFINQAQNVTQTYNILPQPRPTIDPDEAQRLLDRLPLDAIPNPADLPPGSRMALLRNPLFVGREADLKAIAQALKAGGAAAITTGIGGVGKTQLASEFAHRYSQFFAGGVFWLSFADPAGIDAEIAACGGAGALELYTDSTGLTQAEQVAKVYAEWAQPIPRLLIFDNCEDEALLTQRVLRSGGCRVLITSRRGQWRRGLGIAALPLGVLSRAESIALLCSHRDDIGDDEADAIAAELGDLPLALSLAGGYLEIYRDEAFGAPATYLANLRKQLLDHCSLQGVSAAPSLTGHELNVRATFALSYQRLDPDDPVDALAIVALARAAHLAPGEPFPHELLLATLGDATDGEEVAVLRADGVRRLVALGLLERTAGGALRIHRLIAVFARAANADDVALEAVEEALISAANRINNEGYPGRMQPIVAHLRYDLDTAFAREDERAARLCSALDFHLDRSGDYEGACNYSARALAIREQVLGSHHSDTALSLNNLAALLQSQGDYAGARPLYERALAIREQVLGPMHPQTATSLNNLAYLCRSQGDYAKAQPLYERALAIYEQVRGPTHPNTASSLNNLAELLASQGDNVKAQSLYERALAIYEQVLGPTHPNTASSLNNLAELLASQGNYADAMPLYERALAICEQVLGPAHPDTARSLNNLAELLRNQESYVRARALYERALAIYEQVLGPMHPRTATSLNNLALLLASQRDYSAARPLYERALAIREKVLGSTHPDTALSLNNLAVLLASQRDYTEARPLLERALAIAEQVLGPTHPDTATNLNNLAELYCCQGDYMRAKPLYERALVIREQMLGPTHPDTAMSLNNLAGLLYSQGNYTGAQLFYERALAICEMRLGIDHLSTRTVHANLDALNAPPPPVDQQIADLTAQFNATVAQALTDPTIDRIAFVKKLEAVAQQFEDAVQEGSPYLVLATHLHALAAQLAAHPTAESA